MVTSDKRLFQSSKFVCFFLFKVYMNFFFRKKFRALMNCAQLNVFIKNKVNFDYNFIFYALVN